MFEPILAIMFIIIIPLLLVIGGVVAFAMLPVKLGIAVALVAVILAIGIFGWLYGSMGEWH